MEYIVALDEQEIGLVSDLLDYWIDGFDLAKEEVTADRTIETPESLLQLTDSIDVDKSVAEALRKKVNDVQQR